MGKLRCINCSWIGKDSELIRTERNINGFYSLTHNCPSCKFDQFRVIKENSTIDKLLFF